MSEQKGPLASVIMEVPNRGVDATYLAGGLEDAWRDVGAVACAGNHYVGLVCGVEGFTRTEKAV